MLRGFFYTLEVFFSICLRPFFVAHGMIPDGVSTSNHFIHQARMFLYISANTEEGRFYLMFIKYCQNPTCTLWSWAIIKS